MTHDECASALLHYDRRAVVLALVRQIHPAVETNARPENLVVLRRALDAAHGWALGRVSVQEVRRARDAAWSAYAADSASATSSASAYAAYAAAYDASAASAAYAAAYAVAAAQLVDALKHAPAPDAPWLVSGEYVLGGASVWTGAEWVRFGAQSSEISVALDAAQEAA